MKCQSVELKYEREVNGKEGRDSRDRYVGTSASRSRHCSQHCELVLDTHLSIQVQQHSVGSVFPFGFETKENSFSEDNERGQKIENMLGLAG